VTARASRCLLAILLIALWGSDALAADPLNTVRAFCQADGRGERLDPRRWEQLADLVTWPLEPAWDRVYLIRGFQLGTPQRHDDGVDVEVQYTITAEAHSNIVAEGERVETRLFQLVRGDDGVWRVRAPALPPHVFASEADPKALAELLAAEGSSYVSDSAFVWQLMRSAGWTMPYADTLALARAPDFTTERTAEVGDLVLYYDGEQPYHVGIVESEDTVVSATLNGGIRRTPFGGFAGEIRYRRPLITALATPTPEPEPSPTPHRRQRKRK